MNGNEYNNKAYYDTIYQMNNVPDEQRWDFYKKSAEQIKDMFSFRSVLDVGCATGYIVSSFRDLGVQAYGIDISEWAIQQVKKRDRPYVNAQSAFDPLPEKFPQHFDLVTCIEVAEHIPEENADELIARLCELGDYVVFSSSPYDLEDKTHYNVQQSEYWCKRFAEHGYYRTLDRILTLPTEWTQCFTKADWSKQQIIEAYERSIRIEKLESKKWMNHYTANSNIVCTVYFSDDEGYSESRSIHYQKESAGDSGQRLTFSEDIPIPQGCKEIRIDPCEGKLCAVNSLQLIYNGQRIPCTPVNGFFVGNTILFNDEDPKMIVSLPDCNGMPLHFDMTLWLYDVRDVTIESVKKQLDADRKKEASLQSIIAAKEQQLISEHQAYTQEISALRESHATQLEAMEQSHAQQITALSEENEIKLTELRQAHAHEIASVTEEKEAMLEKLRQEYEQEMADLSEKAEVNLHQMKKDCEESLSQIETLQASIAQKDQYIGQVVTLCNDRLTQIESLTDQVHSLQSNNQQLSARCAYAEQNYAVISNAFFWKITKPARVVLDGVKKLAGKNDAVDLSLRTVKWTLKSGPKAAMHKRKMYKAEKARQLAATTWPTEEELKKQRETKFSRDIKFSILVPLYNTPDRFLREMIASVQGQSYQNWELCLADGSDGEHADVERTCKSIARKDKRINYKKLEKNLGISGNTNACIEMATGDYIALFDHDDILHPSALFEVMKAICEKSADFVYTDENTFHDKPADAYCPNFKPDFAPDTLRSNNYICHLSVFSTALLKKAGGGVRPEFDGSQDYDLVLRLTEKAQRIEHIPMVLYYWRSHPSSVASDVSAKPYTITAAKKALAEHLKRVGLTGTVEDSSAPTTYHIKYEIKGSPKISIIIPNKDHIDELSKCINSIREKSTWNNWEIIVVENNSTDGTTFQYYNQLKSMDKRIRVVTWKKEFNYSAICNYGASQATGQYLLMLNNDIEVITPNWLEEMLMFAQRKDVGMVGAMLYYPDDTIQHAGVIVGLGGVAGHSHKYFPRGSRGYMDRLDYAQNLSAVTAACALIPKKVWDHVQGFDEGFAVAFNDVDLCMRVRKAGYLIVWTPYAELYHYESKSRGLEDTEEKQKRFAGEIKRFQNRWGKELEAGDPYYNPNLTLDREDFSIK